MNLEERIKSTIRNIPDFPVKGIQFKDVSTLLANPELMNDILNELVEISSKLEITKVAGIESRGFLFGPALAMRLDVPFVMIRKEGKLPYDKLSYSYELEYGKATIEVHKDSFTSADKVLVHDDLLATGGSALAAASLVKNTGALVTGFSFLVMLKELNALPKLTPITENITNLAAF